MQDKLAAQERKVASGRDIVVLSLGRWQAVNRMERSAGHAEFTRPFVHEFDKGIGAAGYFFGEGDGRIVGRLHHEGIQHVFDGEGFFFGQIYLGAAGFCGFGTDRDLILQRKLLLIDFFEDEQEVHELKTTCRIAFRVGMFFVEDFAGAGLDDNGAQARILSDDIRARLRSSGRLGFFRSARGGRNVYGRNEQRNERSQEKSLTHGSLISSGGAGKSSQKMKFITRGAGAERNERKPGIKGLRGGSERWTDGGR